MVGDRTGSTTMFNCFLIDSQFNIWKVFPLPFLPQLGSNRLNLVIVCVSQFISKLLEWGQGIEWSLRPICSSNSQPGESHKWSQCNDHFGVIKKWLGINHKDQPQYVPSPDTNLPFTVHLVDFHLQGSRVSDGSRRCLCPTFYTGRTCSAVVIVCSLGSLSRWLQMGGWTIPLFPPSFNLVCNVRGHRRHEMWLR